MSRLGRYRHFYTTSSAQEIIIAVERSEAHHAGEHETDDSGPRMEIVTASFLELFELLETYAPSWYTEEHRNRAMAALRALRTFAPTR